MTDLFVHGGQVADLTSTRRADVLVRDGRVAAVGEGLEVPAGTPTLDATGHWVLPGIVDPQVHFREPGGEDKEDLASGSTAAVAGGVTAFLEMPNTNPSTTDPDALNDKLRRAAGRCRADHGFFLGASAENADQLGEWETMPGCSGVKVFMGSSTGNLLVPDDATLERVLRSGTKRVTVHSEDDMRLKERYAAVRPGTPYREHPNVRDVECAVRSTNRLLDLAEKTGRKVHVLHISTAEELDIFRERDLGDLVTCEATPNHLFLAAPDCYDEHGAWAQMNPPVRDRHHQEALRRALVEGPVTCIGSDHAPHTRESKERPFPESTSGIAGVQTTLPLLLTAVRDGWLTLQDVVRLCVAGPTRVYGLEGRSGNLVPGELGSLTVVDPTVTGPITAEHLKSRCPRNPFEGVERAGWPVATIVRGTITWKDGEPVGDPQGEPVRFV
jgi:dihydroorotase